MWLKIFAVYSEWHISRKGARQAVSTCFGTRQVANIVWWMANSSIVRPLRSPDMGIARDGDGTVRVGGGWLLAHPIRELSESVQPWHWSCLPACDPPTIGVRRPDTLRPRDTPAKATPGPWLTAVSGGIANDLTLDWPGRDPRGSSHLA